LVADARDGSLAAKATHNHDAHKGFSLCFPLASAKPDHSPAEQHYHGASHMQPFQHQLQAGVLDNTVRHVPGAGNLAMHTHDKLPEWASADAFGKKG
jgi:hypothetical protein